MLVVSGAGCAHRLDRVSFGRDDHDPPHFHVRYGDQRALVAIETLTVLRGKISPRVLGLVVEWAARRERERMEDWELARAQQQLRPIEPLE